MIDAAPLGAASFASRAVSRTFIDNLITRPARPVMVAPSILSADFARLAEDAQAALDAGAELLHLDVMDGHFVPNLTMGPAVCKSLRAALPDAFLDVHLMVTNPEMFVRPFAEAGASHITFHIEAVADPSELARKIHDFGLTAGLTLSPPTAAQSILPHLQFFDMILIMSVNPGFSGQKFITAALDKAAEIKPLLRPDQRLEIDGGVNPQTAPRCIEAGCDVLVAASAIFHTDNYAQAISDLRGTTRRGEPAPRAAAPGSESRAASSRRN
jgi:ribulose-phosphate 3-epimerase